MNPSNDPNQVCILWHPADRSPADALVRALTKRGLSVMPAASFHTVFAAACRCAKSAQRVVIVLDERDSLSCVDRVLDGLERFAPSAICWEYHAGMNPPIVPLVREMSAQLGHAGAVLAPDPSPNLSPKASDGKLRLVGEEDQSGEARGAQVQVSVPKSGQISSRDILDADELDALLAGEIGKGRDGK